MLAKNADTGLLISGTTFLSRAIHFEVTPKVFFQTFGVTLLVLMGIFFNTREMVGWRLVFLVMVCHLAEIIDRPMSKQTSKVDIYALLFIFSSILLLTQLLFPNFVCREPLMA